MRAAQKGTILVTGATASLRGAANSGSFAASKCALRALAQVPQTLKLGFARVELGDPIPEPARPDQTGSPSREEMARRGSGGGHSAPQSARCGR
eukprot:8044071-Pyramimonas_sp.AAC.1